MMELQCVSYLKNCGKAINKVAQGRRQKFERGGYVLVLRYKCV